ncbi:MAG: flippase-like domain-containing protein [Roseofilum sp. SBFL]|uniref:lysylphosphatidylglycerol synthase transmembrane domain-containing protein n=1 Tax=unclassified Roseofilum TaxID=2620099 RepID=UPI001B14679E|nr:MULTISPECIES: lysylphosphatidylglycerol synthase transmembrane domain-containing protein [unclassified Roseofilum]MBP0015538.1 flippase-like domain-containing protein [Roseofilum sp. SID3]MBP0023815.1 flippase-like domain-containing protein [Roseofilum sp. SID2]MBP0038174.1 flippase-like domain-containing protein [Roseofilum sp. SID1]MBP0043488.1 flippase-like domain-containing protein [Roseofilum sp. SBFL]
MNKIKQTAIKALISLSIIVAIFSLVNLEQIWAKISDLSIGFIIFCLFYYTLLQWISCLRWQVILKSSGYKLPIIYLLKSYFCGMFLNLFLPGSFGGDVYRTFQVSRETQNAEVAAASVLLERVTGLIALCFLAMLGLPFAWRLIDQWDILLVFMMTTGFLCMVWLTLTSPRLFNITKRVFTLFSLENLGNRLSKIQQAGISFQRNSRVFKLSLFYATLFILGVIYYHYLVAQQLNIEISYFELLVFIPMITIVSLLPFSLGGLGIKEGFWVYLFLRIDLTAESAVILSLTITVLAWIISLPGGLLLISSKELPLLD